MLSNLIGVDLGLIIGSEIWWNWSFLIPGIITFFVLKILLIIVGKLENRK